MTHEYSPPSVRLYAAVQPTCANLYRLTHAAVVLAACMVLWGALNNVPQTWPEPSLTASHGGFIFSLWRYWVWAMVLTACSVSKGIGFGASVISLGVAAAVWLTSDQVLVGFEYLGIGILLFYVETVLSDWMPRLLKGCLRAAFWVIDSVHRRLHFQGQDADQMNEDKEIALDGQSNLELQIRSETCRQEVVDFLHSHGWRLFSEDRTVAALEQLSVANVRAVLRRAMDDERMRASRQRVAPLRVLTLEGILAAQRKVGRLHMGDPPK